MAYQVLVNIFIAYLWMFLQDEMTFLNFLSGYFVGLFILFCMRRFFKQSFYIFTFIAIIKLALIFAWELITSAIFVLKHVIRPKVHVRPAIFKVETDLRSDLEITLISLLICLTPGSVVMDVTPDHKILYVHALHMPESKESVMKSKALFEKAIKDVTRR